MASLAWTVASAIDAWLSLIASVTGVNRSRKTACISITLPLALDIGLPPHRERVAENQGMCQNSERASLQGCQKRRSLTCSDQRPVWPVANRLRQKTASAPAVSYQSG